LSYLKELLPKMIHYRLARMGMISPGGPMNLTFSVTNICQSRCKTCNIWELYKKNPEKRHQELTLDEINRIFSSMGHIYIFNVSGGEPFLRKDFTDLVESACRHLKPGIIHIPTNAIAADLVENKVSKILSFLSSKYPDTRLTVKPSLDHIGKKHDEIRGVPGNFKKVIRLFNRLKDMETEYPNFHVELGTVISTWNVKDIKQIADYVTGLGVDSYRNEIAEKRSEMFNIKHPVTPGADEYEKAVDYFVERIRANIKNRAFFHRITNAFRIVYYDLAIKILKENRQVIPCYAGISNAHMNPYGDIWACCTLGYHKSMGNIREHGYDFKSVWKSRQAEKVRAYIKSGQCACPMANQAYSNILLHWPSLLRVFRQIILS